MRKKKKQEKDQSLSCVYNTINSPERLSAVDIEEETRKVNQLLQL